MSTGKTRRLWRGVLSKGDAGKTGFRPRNIWWPVRSGREARWYAGNLTSFVGGTDLKDSFEALSDTIAVDDA